MLLKKMIRGQVEGKTIRVAAIFFYNFNTYGIHFQSVYPQFHHISIYPISEGHRF